MKYLVAVELPWCESAEIHAGEVVVVTDDIEGFGPDLLATYPIQTVEADSPQLAGYRYARRHGAVDVLVQINLSEKYYEEWWMCTDEAHKIDDRVEKVWEPEEEWKR